MASSACSGTRNASRTETPSCQNEYERADEVKARTTIFVTSLLALCAGSSAAAMLTNEQLFENCKIYQTIGNTTPGTSPRAQELAAVGCIAFIGGGLQVYNFHNTACNLSGKTVDAVIADFLTYTRSTGALSVPAATVVHSLLDDCYCAKTRSKAFEEACPKS